MVGGKGWVAVGGVGSGSGFFLRGFGLPVAFIAVSLSLRACEAISHRSGKSRLTAFADLQEIASPKCGSQ